MLFCVLWTCLATPVKNDSITYGKQKIYAKKSASFLTSSLRYCKDKANLSRCFRQTYPNGSKKIVSTCRKLWGLLVCKKVHFFFEILHTHYFEYWAYIALATKNDSNSLKIILMYIFMQNIFESFDHETRPPKTIATTCRKLWSLPTCKKLT